MIFVLPLLANGVAIVSVDTSGFHAKQRDVIQPLAPPTCKADPLIVDTPGKPPRVRLLADMPNAREIKTVFRTVEGCIKPIIVREDIGQRR